MAADERATIAVKLNDVVVTDMTLTWDTSLEGGVNEVEITVTVGGTSKTYTVTVTKAEAGG